MSDSGHFRPSEDDWTDVEPEVNITNIGKI